LRDARLKIWRPRKGNTDFGFSQAFVARILPVLYPFPFPRLTGRRGRGGDLTVYRREEPWEDLPAGWPQRFNGKQAFRGVEIMET
jgi:hypothetical protein